MSLGGGHFGAVGLVPRTLATVAVWSIAVVMGLRLRHPLAELALGALAVCFSIVIWLTPGKAAK